MKNYNHDNRSGRYISIDTLAWQRAEAVELPRRLHLTPG
jgi:hypothetical protein